jgi:hypothetical protein
MDHLLLLLSIHCFIGIGRKKGINIFLYFWEGRICAIGEERRMVNSKSGNLIAHPLKIGQF